MFFPLPWSWFGGGTATDAEMPPQPDSVEPAVEEAVLADTDGALLVEPSNVSAGGGAEGWPRLLHQLDHDRKTHSTFVQELCKELQELMQEHAAAAARAVVDKEQRRALSAVIALQADLQDVRGMVQQSVQELRGQVGEAQATAAQASEMQICLMQDVADCKQRLLAVEQGRQQDRRETQQALVAEQEELANVVQRAETRLNKLSFKMSMVEEYMKGELAATFSRLGTVEAEVPKAADAAGEALAKAVSEVQRQFAKACEQLAVDVQCTRDAQRALRTELVQSIEGEMTVRRRADSRLVEGIAELQIAQQQRAAETNEWCLKLETRLAESGVYSEQAMESLESRWQEEVLALQELQSQVSQVLDGEISLRRRCAAADLGAVPAAVGSVEA